MKKIYFLPFFILICIFSCKTQKQDLKTDSVVIKSDKVVTESDKVDVTSDFAKNGHTDSRFNFIVDDTVSVDHLSELVMSLFGAIEEKIATGDFDGWYAALSYKYRKYISDKSTLLSMSKESDYLYSRNVVLESPKDYFLHIVVPSRQGMSLKYLDYDYIDKNHIKVNCVLDGTLKFVYDFTYENGSWKVDKK